MQAELATHLRNDLVGDSQQQLISESRNPDSAAFDAYMRGMYAFERRGRGLVEYLETAKALFQESIELDPEYGPAYLALAAVYVLSPVYERAPLDEAHARAIELADRAVEIDEDLAAAAGGVRGVVYQKQWEWARAEEAYLEATGARVVDSNAFIWYSYMLAGVGRIEDALEQVLMAQKLDPDSAVVNSRIAIIYIGLYESDRAAEYFDRANQLGASGETHLLGQAILLIRDGRFEEAAELTTTAVSMTGGQVGWVEPLLAALANPEYRDEALAAVDEAFEDPMLDPRLEVIFRGLLDDADGAIRVARSLVESHTVLEMDFLFTPELEPVRAHPGFMDVMAGLGVADYWQERGCVWKDDRLRCDN